MITLLEAQSAALRIRGTALRTPLIRLQGYSAQIHLKLENLQPIGSFKIRGAANAMALAHSETMAEGVYTASAGNMAQGVAWCARELGVSCVVVVPEHAPAAKTNAIEHLGGRVLRVPFNEWWQSLVDHRYPDIPGLFIHPFADSAVMAGNGTIALEILEDLADVDVVLAQYGGGGLACGIAAVMREVAPAVEVYAVEVETAAPLAASLAAGVPTTITQTRTFVDGMGSNSVSTEMWPLARELLAGTVVVSIAEIESAMRVLARRCRVVAEGAGAAALAAAMTARFAGQRVACIVSGGNIDLDVYARILAAE